MNETKFNLIIIIFLLRSYNISDLPNISKMSAYTNRIYVHVFVVITMYVINDTYDEIDEIA